MEAVVVPTSDKQPEHCRVMVKLNDSTLRFESRLPTSGWNGKLAFLGGGGFRGALFEPDRPFFSASVRGDRYATMVTNGGYDYPVRDAGYFQANFAFDPVKLADFTYLSEHRALPFGKELIRKFYGTAPGKSYFEGCSSGGHDAMMLSQRWPNDFDGIVARAPAGNFIGLHMQFNRIAKSVRTPAGMLNPAKQTLLAKAVLARCDKLDGLEDGIISRPAACGYDATELRCTDGTDAGDSCLSDAQIATVKTITSPIATNRRRLVPSRLQFRRREQRQGLGRVCLAIGVVPGRRLGAGRVFRRLHPLVRDPRSELRHQNLGRQQLAGLAQPGGRPLPGVQSRSLRAEGAGRQVDPVERHQ